MSSSHAFSSTQNERVTDSRQHLRIEDLPNEENPREWTKGRKMANVAVIALMSSNTYPATLFLHIIVLTNTPSPQPPGLIHVYTRYCANR